MSKPESNESAGRASGSLERTGSADCDDTATLDWQVFSEIHMKEKGFFPHPRDRVHREYFHWFTHGAHSEMMGRLTPKPNDGAKHL